MKFTKFIIFYSSLRRIIQFTSHNIESDNGASDERYRRIILTAGSSFLVKLFSVAINLITVPLTLKYLGTERYGLWMSISSLMALMAFADFGLGNGLLNEVAKSKGLNNKEIAVKAVSNTFFVLTFVSIILLVLFFIIYPFVSWELFFNLNEPKAKEEAGLTFLALVIPLLVGIPLGIVQRIQDGYQEGYNFQLFQLLGSFISFLSLILCVYFEIGLPGLVFAYSFGSIIASILNAVVLFKNKYRYLLPRFEHFKIKESRILFNTGLSFFVLSMFSLISSTSDNIIIARLLSPSKVVNFEIVKKIFLFSMITQFLIQPLWPAFNEAISKGDLIWVRKTFNKAMKLSIGFGAVISLPLLMFGKQIIFYWVGGVYIPSWMLLFGFYLFVFQANYGGVMSTLLNGANMLRKQIVFIGLASVTSLFLKFTLTKQFGIEGIIWATLISYSVFYILPTWFIAQNFMKKKNYEN